MSVIKIKISELAQKVGVEFIGNGNLIITGVSSIKNADVGSITFLRDIRYLDQLRSCVASAVILSKEYLSFCHADAVLIAQDPYLVYINVVKLLYNIPESKPYIKSGAIIDSNIILGKDINIDTGTIIESGVFLHDFVIIGSGCFIGKDVVIGTGTRLWSNVIVHHGVRIGKYCVIQSGSVIGSDGFGYIKRDNVWIKVPQLGKVNIGNYVEIGACTTVDRGSLDDTQIFDRVIIDNQCQIAHNVIIGENTAIAGGVIIAGSVTVGKCCMIGGGSVINGHIYICDNVKITGMSMVIKSIKIPGVYSSGIPIQTNIEWRRTTVLIMRIRNINKRIKNIEKKISRFYLFKVIGTVYFFLFLLVSIGFILLIYFFIK